MSQISVDVHQVTDVRVSAKKLSENNYIATIEVECEQQEECHELTFFFESEETYNSFCSRYNISPVRRSDDDEIPF